MSNNWTPQQRGSYFRQLQALYQHAKRVPNANRQDQVIREGVAKIADQAAYQGQKNQAEGE